MKFRRVAYSSLLAIALCIGPFVANSLADRNPRYRIGDWRAFTSLRFVTSAAEARDMMYFGTRGGVARYDRYNKRWLPALTTAEGLPSNTIIQLAYDPYVEELYAQTPEGASVYREMWDEWRYTPDFPDTLVQVWEPARLEGWHLPFGYDALQSGFITDPHLRSYEMAGAIEDSYGNSWIGTWGSFVWKQPYLGYDLEPQMWGLYHENVEAIHLDSGMVTFGGSADFSLDGGLSIYDTIASAWAYVESRFTDGFVSDDVHDFVASPDGRFLWMATNDGVVRYDRKEGAFRSFGRSAGLREDRVNTLALDGDILWIGTESGVHAIYLPNDSAFVASAGGVRHSRVNAIVAERDVVWLGTERGLYRLVKPEPEWKRFDRADGALSRSVRSLKVHRGKLYVGLEDGLGVIDLTYKEPAKVYESIDGLPNDNIYDVAVTDSIVWAATPSGLVRFVPATKERSILTTDDGLLANFVQTIVVDGDYLWLGTEHGANRFRWRNPYRID